MKEQKSDLTEISPFTGKRSVVAEIADNGIETKMCMDTGYTTSSEYRIGSVEVMDYEKTTARLIKELRYDDYKLEQHWYLATVTFSTGMIYPDGNKNNWKWAYARIIHMSEEEKKKYPIPGKPGEYYETRLGVDVAEYYPKDQFRDVCKRVGIAKDFEVNG